MLDLQNVGYFVELKQIDRNYKYSKALPFPVSFANKKELKPKKYALGPFYLSLIQQKSSSIVSMAINLLNRSLAT